MIRQALTLYFLCTLLFGAAYPLALALVPAPSKPAPIGQEFTDPGFFWGRPSAAGYNAAASSGSNLGPLNPKLLENENARIQALRQADPGNSDPIPVDLVTASGSGLDPDISPAAALYQAPRVARARNLPLAQVQELVRQHTRPRQWGIFGEPRVNVLELNEVLP